MDNDNPRPLVGLSPEELGGLLGLHGQEPFRGKQIFRQLQRRGVREWDAMTDLSRRIRDRLRDAGVPIAALEVAEELRAADGTMKLALRTRDGHRVETVLIPMDNGTMTQCLSSQVGCAMGCAFCLTGRMGLLRNLDPGEIVDQHHLGAARAPLPIRNLVFMGMGEPLHNFENVRRAVLLLEHPLGLAISPRRITISTCGLVQGIRRMGEESLPALLATSINAPEDALRSELMPVNRRWPLAELVAALRAHPLAPRNRHTIEYVLLGGVNDTPDQARALVRLLSTLRCKVNLIAFNEAPGLPFSAPSPAAVEAFRGILEAKGFTVTLRASKGREILAACGQLAGARPES